VDRPTTYEAIIRSLGGGEILDRFDIDTATPIVYHAPLFRPLTLDDCEREIAENNTILITWKTGKMDSRIRETMRSLKIDTVHKMDGNLKKLREWAVQNGKKVRLVQEK